MAGLMDLWKKKRTGRERPVTSIVVVAAGSAARMEGVDKIMVPLGELPAIVHTLWVFQDCPLVDDWWWSPARAGQRRSAVCAGSTAWTR